MEDAAGWLEAGVDRVIVSTQAVREPAIVRTLADEFGGERVMAGIDARAGEVMIEGWERCRELPRLGGAVREPRRGILLYTNVDVEGGLQQGGIAIEPVTELLRRVKVPVVVSGGISSPGDVAALRKAGAAGAVLGSALYAGKVRLSEAMEAAHANE